MVCLIAVRLFCHFEQPTNQGGGKEKVGQSARNIGCCNEDTDGARRV